MNKNTGLSIGVAVLVVLVGAGVLAFGGRSQAPEAAGEPGQAVAPTAQTDTARDAAMVKDTGTPAPESQMKKEETEAIPEGEAAMNKEAQGTKAPAAPASPPTPTPATQVAGAYEVYAPEKLARATAGDVVLFFHASWCPSCRGLNADIEANAASIPSGVSILKVDYDKETELKKKYGVTTQHTLVQVDAAGNQIKKWSGSLKLSALVSQIQ